jgi:hypothetical protein
MTTYVKCCIPEKPVIPALGRQGQEKHEFKARLGYTMRPISTKQKRIQNQNKFVMEKISYYSVSVILVTFFIIVI